MRRTQLLFVTLFVATLAPAQQVIQLFSENFNTPPHKFSLNTTSLGGPIGNNDWIVNNEYTGTPNYPNTPDQNQVVAGTITGAPFSSYMHIHDKNNAQKNANWNTGAASDNFVEIGTGFCTKAMKEVKISFFWLCEGNADAYGEFYYSINGGAWTKAGQAKYTGQSIWKYELIQDPAWEDKEDIRFGFRWVNQAGGTANNSFAIDDVIAVATYDDVNSPVNINITNFTPNPVCRDGLLIVFYAMSDTFCFGQYRFELSNANCNFSNPINLGFINLNQYTASGAVGLTIPQTLPAGTCYCVRMVRQAPTPVVVGNASGCIEVINCPNVITTHQPVVTIGSGNGQGDSVCVYSVIDVPFNSTGVYEVGNIYTAQLSDTNGNFDTPPAPFIIGSVPDRENYPAIPRGNVSGIIPEVPPGCGYYIRVVSSNPPVIGSPWGPFCIKECDILTNNIQDIHLCIDEEDGDSTQICVDINTWTSNQEYFLGNQFIIEVHSSMTFAIVNVGGLGATFDTASGCFTIYAPPLPQLLAMGLAPGMYYIRIIATDGSLTYDLLGSLVRLTIGAPSKYPPVAINPDSVICSTDITCFTVSPYNFQSQYEWHSPFLNGGQPFIWPGSTLCITFSGFTGTFTVRVRELNNGCYGPWSGFGEVSVLGPPDVFIAGPARVCVGDTVSFSVDFADHTFFEWSAGGGVISDTTNNVADIHWTAPGIYTLQVGAVNPCHADTGNKTVTVVAYPEITSGPDTVICVTEGVTLFAIGDAQSYQWDEPGPTKISGEASTYVEPEVTTTYTITAANGIANLTCPVKQTVTVEVQEPAHSVDSVVICDNGRGALDAEEIQDATYLWNTGATTRSIEITEGGDYAVKVFIPGQVCWNFGHFPVSEKICNELIFIPNAFSPDRDGINEIFRVIGTNGEFLEMKIYSRWGELLFQTNDINVGWDGSFKGSEMPMGVYTYVVHYLDLEDQQQVASGNVSLLR